MSEPSPAAQPVTQNREQDAPWPWWMYLILGLLALGIAAALLGVRTCL